MIRHTSLREVVGADLLRPVSCTDLTAAQIRLFVMAALHLQIIELCPQEGPGLGLILQLGLFRLAVNDDTGRIVGQAHRGVRRVDALSAVAGGTHDIYAHIFIRNIDLNIFIHFRDHCDGAGRCMDPSSRLRHGYTLNAVYAALVFQSRISAFSGDDKADRFHAADPDLFKADRFHAPAPPLGIMHIHSVDFAGKKSCLVAAGAGADLNNYIFIIIGIFGKKQDPEFFLKLRDLFFGRRQFLLGQGTHLLIALLFEHQLRVFGIRARLFVGLVGLHKGSQITLFFHEIAEAFGIGCHIRAHQLPGQILISEDNTLHFFKHIVLFLK